MQIKLPPTLVMRVYLVTGLCIKLPCGGTIRKQMIKSFVKNELSPVCTTQCLVQGKLGTALEESIQFVYSQISYLIIHYYSTFRNYPLTIYHLSNHSWLIPHSFFLIFFMFLIIRPRKDCGLLKQVATKALTQTPISF